MTAEIINLRNVRKQKQREQKETDAAANREKFGQTKADKSLIKKQKQLSETSLDGHKRED